MFQQKFPESDDLPALIKFKIHQIPIKEVVRDRFLHKRIEGTNLIFLGVEVELFEPAVDKLWKSGVFVLRSGEKELIDLAIENGTK